LGRYLLRYNGAVARNAQSHTGLFLGESLASKWRAKRPGTTALRRARRCGRALRIGNHLGGSLNMRKNVAMRVVCLHVLVSLFITVTPSAVPQSTFPANATLRQNPPQGKIRKFQKSLERPRDEAQRRSTKLIFERPSCLFRNFSLKSRMWRFRALFSLHTPTRD